MANNENKGISIGLPCEEMLAAEKLPILRQMYNMAHSELLVRIQQRDQYHVCMIGAIIAASVGIFTSPAFITLRIVLFVFSLISCGVMLFLPYLLCEGYVIYDKRIRVKLIRN